MILLPTEKIKAKNINTVELVARHTEIKHKSKTEFNGRCPLCDDEGKHFYYNASNLTYYCHKCNSKGNIIKLVKEVEGITGEQATGLILGERISYEPKRIKPLKPITTSTEKERFIYTKYPSEISRHVYRDETGKILYIKTKHHDPDGKKFFVYYENTKDNAPDGYLTGLKGVKQTLYRLNIINSLSVGQLVCIAEGEKDVETLESLGFITTTTGGSDTWRKEFSQHFKGLDVVIFPDMDAKGEKYANNISNDLKGIAESVRMVTLPTKDITEFVEKFKATKESIEQLINDAVQL